MRRGGEAKGDHERARLRPCPRGGRWRLAIGALVWRRPTREGVEALIGGPLE